MSVLGDSMRNLLLSVFLFLVTFGVFSAPNLSLAEGKEKPLMIIRFDSDAVNYEENLDKAVKMALDKKPTVFFDLVAISPDTKNKNRNKLFSDDAKFIAKKITDQIKENGVTANMIRTTYQQNKTIKYNEVQIFVQ